MFEEVSLVLGSVLSTSLYHPSLPWLLSCRLFSSVSCEDFFLVCVKISGGPGLVLCCCLSQVYVSLSGAPQINGSASPSSVNGIHTCKGKGFSRRLSTVPFCFLFPIKTFSKQLPIIYTINTCLSLIVRSLSASCSCKTQVSIV